MADSEETSPSRSENHDANLTRLHLERDTVNDTIDILHRQSSLIDEMLALVGRASSTGEAATLQECLVPAGDEDAVTKMKMSAAAKCLAVTELLEKILLCLGPVQLFGVLRVNRMFRDTIEGSQMLRQQMFLEPSTPPHAWLYMRKFLLGYKLARAARPFEIHSFPYGRQKQRCLKVDVWIDFADDTGPELEGSLLDEIEVEVWRRLSEVERDLVDARSESWRRVRLDLPVMIRYHALKAPYTEWPKCVEEDHVEGGITLGALMEKTAQCIRKHCDRAGKNDVWMALHTKLLREVYRNHEEEYYEDFEMMRDNEDELLMEENGLL